MPTAQKAEIIAKAKKWYTDSTGLIFADYRGLDVPSLQTLRSTLRDTGGEFHVVKNTLLRQALGSDVDQLPAEFHNGPTATLFIFKDEPSCAKALVKFAKTNKGLEIKGGVIDGRPMTAAEITELSKLPTKEELLSMIVGLAAAPMSNVVGALNEIIAGPIRCIDAIVEKGGGAAPEATASAEPDPVDGPQSVDDEPAKDDDTETDGEAAGPQSVDDAPEEEPAPDPEPDPEP